MDLKPHVQHHQIPDASRKSTSYRRLFNHRSDTFGVQKTLFHGNALRQSLDQFENRRLFYPLAERSIKTKLTPLGNLRRNSFT